MLGGEGGYRAGGSGGMGRATMTSADGPEEALWDALLSEMFVLGLEGHLVPEGHADV